MSERIRISFLMPAANEESVIARPLEALAALDDDRVEVLAGLDCCTDNTAGIVGGYSFVRAVEFKERQGKPGVLNALLKIAKGDIIIIHDADWRFVCDKDGLDRLIHEFDDPRLGGIVLPPHSIPFLKDVSKVGSRPFLSTGVGVHWLNEFLIERQTTENSDGIYVDKDRVVYPFTVNIIRKEFLREVSTVADDFERFVLLLKSGSRIKIYNDPLLPFFDIIDKRFTGWEHYRRRVRGHIARAQLVRDTGFRIDTKRFYAEFMAYCLKNIGRIGVRNYLRIMGWFLMMGIASVHARLKLLKGIPSAREAWQSRDRRPGS